MKKIKDFTERPIEYNELENTNEYRSFMKWMPKYADGICLSLTGLEYSEFGESKWGFLKDSVTGYEYTVESPVTRGPEVLLLYMKTDNVTSRFLRSRENIYDFMDPMIIKRDYIYLYDLCLVRGGKLELCSCSHERFCYISRAMLNAYKNKLQ
ncbi:MAG: hypothetical protein NC223_04490 [Butyrivibrio sp.]|nr:hypothetical protein [Butyrivibrio sp.]